MIYVCYARYVKEEPVIKIGGYGMLIVITGSMDPAIEEEELIIIKECKEYALGDIVTYTDIYGNLITHRILHIDNQNFVAKGDSNSIADESWDVRNIQGKVVFHSKVLGVFVLYYLKFVIIVYIIWIILIIFINNRIKEKKSEKEENT